MKMVIMKRQCLDELKASLENVYPYYYSDKNNNWIKTLCKEDPFVPFGKEIQDFELAPLNAGYSLGEIDLMNCKILYENLKFLSESQASDERLWAGLANGPFYGYLRERFKYNSRKANKKEVGSIKTRFFFKGGTRAGLYRNSLAKCWWIGRALYDPKNPNHFEKLDIIGPKDFSTKASDIFHNYTFISNPEILDGIVKSFEYMNENEIIYTKELYRPCLQHLNAFGGGLIMDSLTKDEIADELINYIDHMLVGDETEARFDSNNDDDEDDNEEVEEVSVENSSYDEAINDLSLEQYQEVELKTKVYLKDLQTGDTKKYSIILLKSGEITPIGNVTLGKKIGDIVTWNGKEYEITDIKPVE